MRQQGRDNDRLDSLAGALREGRLSAAEAAELRQLLQSHAALRRRFTEHMFLAAALKRDPAERAHVRPYGGRWSVNRERLEGGLWFGAGIALAIAVFVPLVLLWPGSSDRVARDVAAVASSSDFVDHGVAVLAEAVDVQWAENGLRARVGASLPKGRLKIEKGWARIDFYSGASVVLQGQADLELVSPMESILHGGAIRAHVPSHAHGFVVHSRELKLVDQGTSFGMRVDAKGGTEVHVFEGKVELHDSASGGKIPRERRELAGGTAVRIARDGSSADLKADAGEFTEWREIERRSDEDLQQRFRSWQTASSTLANDPRLIAYYPFDRDPSRPRRLANRSIKRDETLAGSIVGCNWSQGRWPGKDALEFKRPGDRVRIEVPGNCESLTLMAWVRPDSLDNRFNSLLLSDGWNRPGAVHWQLVRSHQLSLSVWNRAGIDPDVRSRPVLDPYDLGCWMHLAAVYDSRRRLVSLYLNGQPIGTQPMGPAVRLKIGTAEIGNWSTLNYPDQAPIRNFNGRIDELAIFSSALDDAELQRMYQSGRP